MFVVAHFHSPLDVSPGVDAQMSALVLPQPVQLKLAPEPS